MAEVPLVSSELDASRALIAALVDRGFPVSAAFWLNQEEVGWRLIIITPLLREVGLQEAYGHLADALTVVRHAYEARGEPSPVSHAVLKKDGDDWARKMIRLWNMLYEDPDYFRFVPVPDKPTTVAA